MIGDTDRPLNFHTVSRLMTLARKFRHAPGDLYDKAYKELEEALYFALSGAGPVVQKEGFLFGVGEEVTHVKTQGRYVIVSTDPLLEASGRPAYGYSRADGSSTDIYVRDQVEMEDGRFVKTN